MRVDFHLHPSVEWKVVRQHVTRIGAVAGTLAALWFVGTCWNTYTEAMATYEAVVKPAVQTQVRAANEVKKNE